MIFTNDTRQSKLGWLTSNEENQLYRLMKRVSEIRSAVVRCQLLLQMGQLIDVVLVGDSQEPLDEKIRLVNDELNQFHEENGILLKALGYKENDSLSVEEFIEKLVNERPEMLEDDEE